MLQKGQRPHPAALAALVLIRHVALASLNSSQAAAPHPATEDRSQQLASLENLDRWLALALECTVEGNDAPVSLKGWLDRARGPDDRDAPDSLLDQVNSFQTAVSYCFLRGHEAQLLINPVDRFWNWPNEDYVKRSLGSSKVRAHKARPAANGELTICVGQIRIQIVRRLVGRRRGTTVHCLLQKRAAESFPRDKQLTISSQPQPLLRSSPLGLFVRRNYLTLSRMDLDELQDWWISFERWIDGEKRGKRRALEYDDSSTEFACVGPLSSSSSQMAQGASPLMAFGPGDETRSYSRARARQDYHQARELVRAFPNSTTDPEST